MARKSHPVEQEQSGKPDAVVEIELGHEGEAADIAQALRTQAREKEQQAAEGAAQSEAMYRLQAKVLRNAADEFSQRHEEWRAEREAAREV